jgi:hypothetical protein
LQSGAHEVDVGLEAKIAAAGVKGVD